jgi:hypothetical protein
MFIKIALSAAIVLGAAAMASAATKSNKIAVHRSGPPAQSTVPRTPRFSNPDSPAATGGGSLGYLQLVRKKSGGGVCAEAPVRALQVAWRQILP